MHTKGSSNPPHNGHLSTLEAFGLAADIYLDSEVKTKLVRQWGYNKNASVECAMDRTPSF